MFIEIKNVLFSDSYKTVKSYINSSLIIGIACIDSEEPNKNIFMITIPDEKFVEIYTTKEERDQRHDYIMGILN